MDSINKIEESISSQTYEEFMGYTMAQDAVIRQLEVIGEAVKSLPENFRENNPIIPWKGYAGMRDKLIHHYFGVDLRLIWETIKEDLPHLKRVALEEINENSEN